MTPTTTFSRRSCRQLREASDVLTLRGELRRLLGLPEVEAVLPEIDVPLPPGLEMFPFQRQGVARALQMLGLL